MKLELGQVRESRDQLKSNREKLQKELASKNQLVKTQEEVYNVLFNVLDLYIYTSIDEHIMLLLTT